MIDLSRVEKYYVACGYTDMRQKLERMNELLLNAQRARFGSSSEKQDYVMPNHYEARSTDRGRRIRGRVVLRLHSSEYRPHWEAKPFSFPL